MSAPGFGDDIPLARRSTPRPRRQASLPRRLIQVLLTSALLAGGAVLLLIGPFRSLITPTPVPGLAARLGPDGRLLGHFPYPEANPEELVAIAPGLLLQPQAAGALEAMRAAAEADGIVLTVLSAYRSHGLQKQLFFDVKAERNQTSADRARVSAPPGFSEHSTGYAVDLGDGRLPATNLMESFENTDAYRWLDRHAARFHFVRSFPKGNRQGVIYEPWHWRFEGSTDALEMFEPAQRLGR
ncbi:MULTISPECIES: D-alanyl-D-alanine carboxypeptidase family protein [unclassified Cyanobium]|uniref:M15 family metallopeptidase n=1 Tax=unclassified Cyanobium TaxID=2627006 RepID=UPI0020CBF0A3|nr:MULTISPECIES: M15 family metallopeptidase [unclassified Cyanobium]MCP9858287.1 D-alanyl-D-alanine carboxypeptidase family protein [Cyanobium sp. Cruz-8H5]MCP9865668.1 D-alanyl-D-alanine carboxypeptidase family protein [Cyanobium sp. Cruz-8D1]